MSFANIDLEAQKEPLLKGKDNDANYTSPDELDTIIGKTSRQLLVFGNLISQFETQRKQIGTRRDTQELRNTIDVLTGKIQEMDRAILALIANLSTLINLKNSITASASISNRHIVIEERLSRQYSELSKAFNKSTKVYQEKKRITPLLTGPSKETEEQTKSEDTLATSQQEQEQVQTQVDQDLIDQTELQYHILLTEERNREIEQVTEGIMEVNSIFKDLSQLVHQQGEQVNTIEDNILQLHGNTQQASNELNKANEYQKQKGKWSCILLVALCIFLLVIVLIVVS